MEENLHTTSHSSHHHTSHSSQQQEEVEGEEYINMEVDHHHPSFNSSIFSQSTNKEFEFQSFSSSSDRDHNAATTSPADELFYMGKLLPLHLPPRLEMVNKILQNPHSFTPKKGEEFDDESFSTPLFTPTSNTPFESCNISPSESCHISRELNPNEYFVEYLSSFQEKKTWTKKLKMIKQASNNGSKMKWSSYIKSLFAKTSGCSDEHSAAADQRQFSKAKQCVSKNCKNFAPFGEIKYNNNKENKKFVGENRGGGHRRSFSGALKRLSKPKTSSKSISNSMNSNQHFFKRSISSSSEIESPIQAAIAHCKRSQNSRQIADEVAFCTISASSRMVCDDQEREGICRG